MSELLTLITCTGGRPEAFKLCAEYIARQTYKAPIQWIVVDDMPKAPTVVPRMPSHIQVQKIWGPVPWKEGYNTQRSNMEAALKFVKGNIIAIPEDDDWFSPQYLEACVKMLYMATVVGDTFSRYYHVGAPGWKLMANDEHSSLSSTVFRKEALPYLEAAVNSGHFYFDVEFFRIVKELNLRRVFYNNVGLFTGIKGLPGKPGITGSHRDIKGFFIDPNHAKLKSWVGEADAQKYIQIMKGGKSVGVRSNGVPIQKTEVPKPNPFQKV